MTIYHDDLTSFFSQINNCETETGEILECYNYIIDCYITDKRWEKFLKSLKKKFEKTYMKINENTDFMNKLEYSKFKMRCYVKDTNSVLTIDTYDGILHNKLVFKRNRKFRCNLKTYIVNDFNNIYLINEVMGIIYY